jgi:Flp pilus assembly protein TadD
LAKLLDAYRRNRTTDQAIPEVFGVSKEDFERGYVEYLNKIVADIRKSDDIPEFKPSQIEREYNKNKDDPDAAAQYARLLLLVKKRDEARKLAETVLKKKPAQPIAATVVGALLMRDDKYDEATKVLTVALDREHPDKNVLELLMRSKLKQKETDAVFELCELGREHFPDESDWLKGIAAASKLTGDNERRKEALKKLTVVQADDPAPRKALAEMALADHRFDEAFKYAKMALHIDVMDADIHRCLAAALRGLNQLPRSIAEYETALELKPKDVELQLGLAECLIDADRKADAKKLVEEVLAKDAANEQARRLSKQFSNAKQD